MDQHTVMEGGREIFRNIVERCGVITNTERVCMCEYKFMNGIDIYIYLCNMGLCIFFFLPEYLISQK